VVAEAQSRLTLIESYVGLDDCVTFTNAVTEIAVGDNAAVDHYKLNQESLSAFHIATTQIELARGANFASHSFTLGSSLTRNDFNAGLRGEGIECTLNGLYLGRHRQLIDNHTAIDHAMPHCASHELYKGILDDRARGVFNGKIFVRQDAQKTDAKQTNQTLLLSNEAQIDTKPQLEIFADDVRCTHGATIGQLSAEALFYLRSRGIGRAEARAMLTYAFARDVVNRVKLEPLRLELEQSLFRLLSGA
jgi:Fe-S cluster assembly protein SufD